MKIDLRKIVRPLNLTGYAPEYLDADGKPVQLWVWVNPPSEMTEARIAQSQVGQALQVELKTLDPGDEAQVGRAREIFTEFTRIGQEALEWLSAILSAGPEEARMSSAELSSLVEESRATDPHFYPWLLESVWQMIGEFRIEKKKA